VNCAASSDLKRAFAAKSDAYREARSSAFYRVTTGFAAQRTADMERARYALEEHYRVCIAADNSIAPSPESDVSMNLSRPAA